MDLSEPFQWLAVLFLRVSISSVKSLVFIFEYTVMFFKRKETPKCRQEDGQDLYSQTMRVIWYKNSASAANGQNSQTRARARELGRLS